MIVKFTARPNNSTDFYYIIQTKNGRVVDFRKLWLSTLPSQAITEAKLLKQNGCELSVVNSKSEVIYANGKPVGDWRLPHIEADWHRYTKKEWTTNEREIYARHRAYEHDYPILERRYSEIKEMKQSIPRILISDESHFIKN